MSAINDLIDRMTEAEYLSMLDMKWVADRLREFAEEQDNAPAVTGKLITGAEWDEYQRLKEQKPTAPAGMVEEWDMSFVKDYVATCGIMKKDFLSSTMLEEFVLAAIQEHHKRFGRK